MIAVILSWIAIAIVFLSLGDLFIFLYNKYIKQPERYGATDTFLLGMCFTLIPLSFISLWFPANQYVLFIFLLVSVLYWILRKNRFLSLLTSAGKILAQYSLFQKAVFVIPIIGLLGAILWQTGIFDSLFYHQQNILWNEKYAVVPGIGNLDHRFGFNSNYLLLSSVFSLRFIFEEAVYALQVLVFLFVFCRIIKEVIDSGYEMMRIVLLIVTLMFLFTFGYAFTASSTDAIPNVLSLYLLVRLILYPNDIKAHKLLYIIIPITLVTFKLTIVPLCLISLYAIILLWKDKDSRAIIFLVLSSLLIVGSWLIRNVIISGYLVFPFHELNFFNVDWKIPKYVAEKERAFIWGCGDEIWIYMMWRLTHIDFTIGGAITWLSNFTLLFFMFVSPLAVLYSYIRKNVDNRLYYLYLIFVLIIAIWYIGGPDPRFIGGAIFALIYYTIYIVLKPSKQKHFKIAGQGILAAISVLLLAWPAVRAKNHLDTYGLAVPKEGMRPVSDILYRPYPYKEMMRYVGFYSREYVPYTFDNGLVIYMSKSRQIPYTGGIVCFDDPFPGSVFRNDNWTKYLDITEIEPRGESLQDGFRPIK